MLLPLGSSKRQAALLVGGTGAIGRLVAASFCFESSAELYLLGRTGRFEGSELQNFTSLICIARCDASCSSESSDVMESIRRGQGSMLGMPHSLLMTSSYFLLNTFVVESFECTEKLQGLLKLCGPHAMIREEHVDESIISN